MSCAEVCRVKATSSIDIHDLVASFESTCKQNDISQQELLTQLLDELGLESTGVIRYKKPKLELTNDIIKFLKTQEQIKAYEIADANAYEKARIPKLVSCPLNGKKYFCPTTTDTNRARWLIIATLMNFECCIEGMSLNKTKLITCLGYTDRTIRSHDAKNYLEDSSKAFYKIYTAFQREILNKFCQ